jgi:hypothetical protein
MAVQDRCMSFVPCGEVRHLCYSIGEIWDVPRSAKRGASYLETCYYFFTMWFLQEIGLRSLWDIILDLNWVERLRFWFDGSLELMVGLRPRDLDLRRGVLEPWYLYWAAERKPHSSSNLVLVWFCRWLFEKPRSWREFVVFRKDVSACNAQNRFK